jgi:septum site-determining protein MinD
MGESIVITSGKGGVGKTTTSANLGTALAILGKKVCMVDTDIGLRNLDVVMGLENRIVYDIVDVAEGRCRTVQALIKDKRFDDLYLLPAAQTKDKDSISPDMIKPIIQELKLKFDFVIIDCPAGIEQGFRNAISGSDKAIIVTTPDNSAVRDADRIVGLLRENSIDDIRLIVNRTKPDMIKRGDMLDVEDITSILGIELLGIIPDDEDVIKSNNSGEPIVMDASSKAAIAYRNVAKAISGDPNTVPVKKNKVSLFSRMKTFIGIKG